MNPLDNVEAVDETVVENVDIVYDSDGNSVFGDLCTSGGRLNAYKALCNE